MSTYKLSNVHNGLNGYNQLKKLYETYKDDLFEDIKKEKKGTGKITPL